VTVEPRAFFTLDLGTASVAAALVGRVDGRWRLLASGAVPEGVGPEPLLRDLVARVGRADPGLAAATGLPADPADAGRAGVDLARVTCRTTAPPRLVVLAASRRGLEPLVQAARTSGWSPAGIALDERPLLDVVADLASPSVSTVLAGTSEPPGADEGPQVPELVALLAAATERRPELSVVLAGGLAAADGHAARLADHPGGLLLAPSGGAGDPPGEALRELLDAHRAAPEDGRRALARATGTLAAVLRRRVEVVDVGRSAGARVAATPVPGGASRVLAASVAGAALVPSGADDVVADEVAGWLTFALDRLRLGDRLAELALEPWADAAGDGALLRMAAVRAALVRLLGATSAFRAFTVPELIVATGGAWAVAPGPAVALALADAVRRPGAAGLGLDHARMLAPLGMIEDAEERRRVMADLRDDLLVPLGSVITAADLRPGRTAGRAVVHAAGGPVTLDLVPGGLELVDLPPGERAVVELRFRDPVDTGARARHVAVEVAGGLGGLLLDLRDVPIRLPARPERRRDVLASWQAALWAGVDR
jgi:hypothetical protein